MSKAIVREGKSYLKKEIAKKQSVRKELIKVRGSEGKSLPRANIIRI